MIELLHYWQNLLNDKGKLAIKIKTGISQKMGGCFRFFILIISDESTTL